jgi:hypothetical protein
MRGVKERCARPRREQGVVCLLAAAAGLLGLVPGATGDTDPLGMLVWLTLLAPAAGAACGAVGLRILPYGLVVPGSWASMLFAAILLSDGDLPAPVWGAAAIAGLFGLGVAVGAACPGRPIELAAAGLFAGIVMLGLSVQLGIPDATSLARTHPRIARVFLELQPVVLVSECAGCDWVRTQPQVYARSGVEWLPRRPYRGPLAGSVALVVGCALGEALVRRSSRRVRDPST